MWHWKVIVEVEQYCKVTEKQHTLKIGAVIEHIALKIAKPQNSLSVKIYFLAHWHWTKG